MHSNKEIIIHTKTSLISPEIPNYSPPPPKQKTKKNEIQYQDGGQKNVYPFCTFHH